MPISCNERSCNGLTHDDPVAKDAGEPDSLMGAIMAIEGIADAAVLLNGPTGCKTFYGFVSDQQYPRADHLAIDRDLEEFYFGQPRIPTTYLDEQDYVLGPGEKLAQIFPAVATRKHALIAIVNSPGAALIGDDLQRFLREARSPVPTVAIEAPGFSSSMASGHQDALISAIEALDPPVQVASPTCVNLLGLSIYHQHWQGSLTGLRELLRLMGIEVVAAPGAGSSVEEIRALPRARFDLVIHQEYADQLAPWLEARYDIPTLIPSAGAPVGFDATESWLREIAAALDLDPAPALARVRDARHRAYGHLNHFHRHTGLPKGATFAIRADASLACPLLQWLHAYLGMVPTAVQLSAGEDTPLAATGRAYLDRIGCDSAWDADLTPAYPDLVLGSGAVLARFVGEGQAVAGVELSQPATARIDIVPKALLGSDGALYLLERILNELHDHLA